MPRNTAKCCAHDAPVMHGSCCRCQQRQRPVQPISYSARRLRRPECRPRRLPCLPARPRAAPARAQRDSIVPLLERAPREQQFEPFARSVSRGFCLFANARDIAARAALHWSGLCGTACTRVQRLWRPSAIGCLRQREGRSRQGARQRAGFDEVRMRCGHPQRTTLLR